MRGGEGHARRALAVRERDARARRRPQRRGDARDDLERHPRRRELLGLLAAAPEDERIAALEAHDARALERAQRRRADGCAPRGAGIRPRAVRPGCARRPAARAPGSPGDTSSSYASTRAARDEPMRAHREQLGIARPRADEPHLAARPDRANPSCIDSVMRPPRPSVGRSRGRPARTEATSLARPSATMTTTTARTSAVSPRSRPVSSSCPSPPETKSSSPAMSDRSANVQPIFAPPRMPGSAAGRVTVSMSLAPRAPIVRAARSIEGGTCRTAFSVATATGSAAPRTTTSWMAHSLRPNQRMASGSQQIDGTELEPEDDGTERSASRERDRASARPERHADRERDGVAHERAARRSSRSARTSVPSRTPASERPAPPRPDPERAAYARPQMPRPR